LKESGAITLDELIALHRSTGVTTAADLANLLRHRRLAAIPHLDPTLSDRIANALPHLRARERRISLGRAATIAEPILEFLRAMPHVNWAEPVGSLRRGHDLIGDVEIVASVEDPAGVLQAITAMDNVERVRQRAARQVVAVVDGVQVAVRCPMPTRAPALLLLLTGHRAHLDRLDRIAADRQLTLTAGGAGSEIAPDGQSEEEIYAALGLPFIPPELRNGENEIDLAFAGRLPSLISRGDIRGDLHMHTHWSDGRDSIADMVEQCIALGYEYVAITDHSTHSAASRNLSIDDVRRQGDEIASLRERYPQLGILHGAEVDILENGRLDFPERVLRDLDIVLASLHNRAGHSPDNLLRRYESAMRNPLVAIVTHPMNRPGPERLGYEIDVDRLFELAVRTDTVLEIDGSPSHLDLEASLARRAIQAGVTLAIDSDAHRTEMLDRHMKLGLLTARRGWVEPRHVLNVRSRGDVTAFLARKRER
jgi:DNA polymerase (family 10)